MNKSKLRTILIIANGEPPSELLITGLVAKSDCIIAADGGSNILHRYAIYPDYIIGDLDSVQKDTLTAFKKAQIIHLAGQDHHDLAKAVTLAKSLNPEIIRIIGAFGKRLDHTLANLHLLQSVFSDTVIEFYDQYGCLSAISGDHRLNLPVGRTISLFSFLPVYGVTLEGFQYPLYDADFSHGFNGLSNVISAKPARISIKKGYLLIYITNDNITS